MTIKSPAAQTQRNTEEKEFQPPAQRLKVLQNSVEATSGLFC